MELRNFLSPDAIIADLQCQTKEEAIRAVLECIPDDMDRDRAFEDIWEREEDYSTGLEDGIAFPHARTDAVKDLCLGFARSLSGLDFGSRDGKPSYFIPLLLTPKSSGKSHIIVLAEMIRKLEDPDLRRRLLAAADKAELYALLTE